LPLCQLPSQERAAAAPVRLAYADFDCRAKSALYSTPYLVLSDAGLMFQPPEWSRSTWAINRDHSTGNFEQLLVATLDQIISDRAEAETFC